MGEQAKQYNLDNSKYYNNRELSWLDFNYRVLEEAFDSNNPLLEQLKFIAIHSSNLDEFFMVRVAGLKDQIKMNFNEPENKAQLTPKEQLICIEEKNRINVDLQYKRFNELKEKLKTYNIYITQPERLPEILIEQLHAQFNSEILPTLSPLGIDAYRPLPKLNNKMLNLFVDIKLDDGEIRSAIVPVPVLLDRIIKLEHEGKKYIVFLEDVISLFIEQLFNGYEVINMSISDYKTNNAMTRVDRVKRLNPAVVILGFGVNDISTDDEIKPGKFAANLTNIIETLGSSKVILLSPPYIDWIKDPTRPWTRQLQFELVTEHLSKQLDVSYIDLLHDMANCDNLNDLLQADGLHFTKQGYSLLEDELIPEIKATLTNQLVSN